MRFGGYASVFGVIDSQYDEVVPGAFEKSLIKREGRIAMLFNHDPAHVIGHWDVVKEDPYGLWVEGFLVDSDMVKLVSSNSLFGLSIGYEANTDQRTDTHRKLVNVDLREISLVACPCNIECYITQCEGWT